MKKFTFGLRKQPQQCVCALTHVYLVIRNPSLFLKVAGHLQSITGIALESIAELSYAILTHSVGASTPGRQRPVPPHLVAGALRAATSPTHEAGGIHPK